MTSAYTKLFTRKTKIAGYSLVELIVAVTLFTIVVTISSSSTLVMLNSSKSISVNTTLTDNLQFALDDMMRHIRTGTTYRCGSYTATTIGTPQDCTGGGIILALEPQGGKLNDNTDQIVYRLQNNKLMRSNSSGVPTGSFFNVLDDRITVTNFVVRVEGSRPLSPPSLDQRQPRVRVTITASIPSGSASVPPRVITLQSSATQRSLDI